MKTAHRKAARAKIAQRNALFDPGTDITPQEHARRKRHADERAMAPTDVWKQTWQPLPSDAPTPCRPGADDYLRHPSLVGGERVSYYIKDSTQ